MSAAWPVPSINQQRARRAVQNAVKKGLLLHIRTQRCVDCNEIADDYDHHLGYDEQNWLEVKPRCRTCHNLRHTERELEAFPDLTASRRQRAFRRSKEAQTRYKKRWDRDERFRQQRRQYFKQYYNKRKKAL